MEVKRFSMSYFLEPSSINKKDLKILATVTIFLLGDFGDDYDDRYGIREESCRHQGINII